MDKFYKIEKYSLKHKHWQEYALTWEQRLARVVRAHRRATVAQIANQINPGSNRKGLEHIVHHSLL